MKQYFTLTIIGAIIMSFTASLLLIFNSGVIDFFVLVMATIFFIGFGLAIVGLIKDTEQMYQKV